VVRLTTTGAKTGIERTVPLVGLRDGEEWVLIASNWGRDEHPAWYHNLRANPEVRLGHEGQTGRYVARVTTGGERDAYLELASEAYVGYDLYRRRSGDRSIPVVVLTPAPRPSS
jgi:deazaflavin-dependent oxidoreductase (nitroreductase family)